MVTVFLALMSAFSQPSVSISLHDIEDKNVAAQTKAWIEKGARSVEQFFGKPYPKPFTADVYGNRNGLDAEMKRRWNMPPSEKWMVASGAASGLLLLSPATWKTEAIGHDGTNGTEVQKIVTHELTHVYHGQRCPQHEFDGMDEMAWFIEGLATYVAGQLGGRSLTARQAIESGKAPKSLVDAWSGSYRYGVSGAMVRYIDKTYGRKTVIALLEATSNSSALKMLRTNEEAFLRNWKAFELKQKD